MGMQPFDETGSRDESTNQPRRADNPGHANITDSSSMGLKPVMTDQDIPSPETARRAYLANPYDSDTILNLMRDYSLKEFAERISANTDIKRHQEFLQKQVIAFLDKGTVILSPEDRLVLADNVHRVTHSHLRQYLICSVIQNDEASIELRVKAINQFTHLQCTEGVRKSVVSSFLSVLDKVNLDDNFKLVESLHAFTDIPEMIEAVITIFNSQKPHCLKSISKPVTLGVLASMFLAQNRYPGRAFLKTFESTVQDDKAGGYAIESLKEKLVKLKEIESAFPPVKSHDEGASVSEAFSKRNPPVIQKVKNHNTERELSNEAFLKDPKSPLNIQDLFKAWGPKDFAQIITNKCRYDPKYAEFLEITLRGILMTKSIILSPGDSIEFADYLTGYKSEFPFLRRDLFYSVIVDQKSSFDLRVKALYQIMQLGTYDKDNYDIHRRVIDPYISLLGEMNPSDVRSDLIESLNKFTTFPENGKPISDLFESAKPHPVKAIKDPFDLEPFADFFSRLKHVPGPNFIKQLETAIVYGKQKKSDVKRLESQLIEFRKQETMIKAITDVVEHFKKKGSEK